MYYHGHHGSSRINERHQDKTFTYKNEIVKITNLLVSTVARNSGNCNLISRLGCYGYANMYL